MRIPTAEWKFMLLKGTDRALARGVIAAIQTLLDEDKELLARDVNERAITARLAEHLRPHFLGWHVDCEYNRDGHVVKKVSGEPVVPDIIVHHRGVADNLLVIEVKKSNSREPDREDLEKLALMRRELGYKHALFLKLTVPEAGISRILWVYPKRGAPQLPLGRGERQKDSG